MATKYKRGIQLGEGTWGNVFEAERRDDALIVAIKRIKPMYVHLGMNFTALREVKYLRFIKGPNVIDLLDVFNSDGVLHLVLEYCPFDLERVIRDKTLLLRGFHTKSYLQMLLRGIECCHKHFVLHRDLKPANLLFGWDGQMKLADFGLARGFSSPEQMTSEVVTRWYRSPELLFGAPCYAAAIDIWAAGCIFAEILFRVPLFPGDSDVEQLAKIFNLLGTPTAQNWPHASLLPNYIEFEPREPLSMMPLFRRSSSSSSSSSSSGSMSGGGGDGRGGGGVEAGGTGTSAEGVNSSTTGSKASTGIPPELDLLLRMLTLDPNRRISASQALAHPYFTQLAPRPCAPAELPVPKGVNMKHKKNRMVVAAEAPAGTGTGTGTDVMTAAGPSTRDVPSPSTVKRARHV